ncbi:MAG: hypothetical protein ACRDWI_06260 [Jiangellaceae bacterium]
MLRPAWCGYGSSSARQQILVVGVPFDPTPDERALRDNALATGACIVEERPGELAADALALRFGGDLGSDRSDDGPCREYASSPTRSPSTYAS